ncbi:LOW QUALITY PROTEIN: uncharacterized protein [Amphiura filiformis]|uniref:LOW QUALITY PROTEIN: uncharacterized protein n=1 Tax=Amphiura filiformis TaxID=82378 RepID=UPI003B215EA4
MQLIKDHISLYHPAVSQYRRAHAPNRRYLPSDKAIHRLPNKMVVPCNMQKVIMLPRRMPGIKSSVFTRRLVQFHKTFVQLREKRKGGQPAIGVIWNESQSGRNAEDVACTFMKFPNVRDKKRVIMYMDNCSAQNKNWTIFTAMVDEVNRPGGQEEIISKYFEKGHTLISADSFHHLIEKGMRDRKPQQKGDDGNSEGGDQDDENEVEVDKIECTALLQMDDSAMKNYISAYGDRLDAVAFCRLQDREDGSSESSVIGRLRKKYGKRNQKRKEADDRRPCNK